MLARSRAVIGAVGCLSREATALRVTNDSQRSAAVLVCCRFLIAILLLGFISPIAASDVPIQNYVTRMWRTEDGLPHSGVTAVLQGRDGYLWVGTRSGLARLDGVRFTVFDGSNTEEMQSPHVTSLFEASDGTLWIGHETGE